MDPALLLPLAQIEAMGRGQLLAEHKRLDEAQAALDGGPDDRLIDDVLQARKGLVLAVLDERKLRQKLAGVAL